MAEQKSATAQKPSVSTKVADALKRIDGYDNHSQAAVAARALLAEVEAGGGAESLDAARVLDTLGERMWFGGKARDPETRALIERSIAIKEKVLGPEDPHTAESIRNLATLLWETGDYSASRVFFERALAIQEKALKPGDSEYYQVAWTLINFGILLQHSGDYLAAKQRFEQALRIYENHPKFGPTSRAAAIACSNLVEVLTLLGDYTTARQYADRTLAIAEKRYSPENPFRAAWQVNLAEVLARSGDYERAEPQYANGLALLEKALGPEHPDLGGALTGYATLLRNMGKYAKAKELYQRALVIQEKALGNDHPELAKTLLRYGELLADMGDRKSAAETALRAESIARDHLRLTSRTLAEREALAYASSRSSAIDLLVNLAAATAEPATARDAFDNEIRSRALVLDEMGYRHHAISASADSQVSVLAEQVASARGRLSRLVLGGPGNDSPERYRELTERDRREKEQAEHALAERSAPFRREQARSLIGLKELAAAVPPDSAVLAFVRYARYSFGQRHPAKPAPSYLAFVLLRGETEPKAIVLGPANEIESLASAWRQQIEQEPSIGGHASKRSEAKYRVSAAALRRKVWDPVTPYLHGANRVFVVPDGALNLVNFAALPVGQTSYLIEKGPVIHYLSAERDLVATPSEQSNQGLFALGGPAFDDPRLFASLAHAQTGPAVAQAAQPTAPQVYRGNRSACGPFQSMHFEALPGSRRETDQIVSLWERSAEPGKPVGASNAAPMPGVIYLKGAEASETAFKQQAPGHRVLHLATHGFFLGGRCASALDSDPDSQGGDNPLLLSGLVLAGANHRQAARPEEDDGILTAEEIAAMNLEGVEWAVLSGCDTGVGEIKTGEGVFGLRRAFQIAGAHTVIMSLWPVEDTTARQWMTTLYRQRFVQGLSTAESVREASLTVLRQRRARQQSTHPFYWGSFVAAGDWR